MPDIYAHDFEGTSKKVIWQPGVSVTTDPADAAKETDSKDTKVADATKTDGVVKDTTVKKDEKKETFLEKTQKMVGTSVFLGLSIFVVGIGLGIVFY